jgi:ligand-binding sensor domain-containing protein
MLALGYKKLLIILLGLLLYAPFIWSQTPTFSSVSFTTENSRLSHNTVLSMFQDSRGFIWISTMDGLNRFDGQTMKIYRHNPADSTTISNSFIHGVFERADGMIWIGTRDGGINILNPMTDEITRIQFDPANPLTIPNAPVNVMYRDSQHQFWLGFFTGQLGFYDEEAQAFFPADFRNSQTGEVLGSINSVLELGDGSFLFSSLNGMYYAEALEVARFRKEPTTAHLSVLPFKFSRQRPFPNTSNLYLDDVGSLWVEIVGEGFELVNPIHIPEQVKKSLQTGWLTTSTQNIIHERPEYLLKGAGNGALQFIDKITKKTSQIPVSSEEVQGAATLFEDNNGNLWFYSWGDGLYLLEEKKGVQWLSAKDGLPSNFTLAFADEGDDTWVGTNNGLAYVTENGLIADFTKLIPGFKKRGGTLNFFR